jgi:DNA (cytosine-5)-methyltransferase 1
VRVIDFVESIKPEVVVMENVPNLAANHRFQSALRRLRNLDYGVRCAVIDAADFGVPQRRRRLILVALRGVSDQAVPALTKEAPSRRVSVRQAFSRLRTVTAKDPLHRPRTDYPELVAQRIAAIPADGGSRSSLPPELRLECHKRLATDSHASGNVYGRMKWDEVAPTLTTRCTTPACGRYLHPQENRAITLREAAVLQTFPIDYRFEGGVMAVQAQIGNAVPPTLAREIAMIVLRWLGHGERSQPTAALRVARRHC